MSDKRDREKRREERLAEESKVDAQDRRTRILQMGAAAVFLVIVVVVALIVVNSSSNSGSGGDTNFEHVSEVDSLLGNTPQQGLTLGNPKAPVELIEFGDLQCPICKAYAEEMMPPVIEGQVAQGQAKITFRNFTIISEQSVPAGAAALAAGEQGRGWQYLEIFYHNQGEERSGYVTEEFLTGVAKAAGVKDIAKWNKDRKSAKITGEVKKTTEEAQRLGFTGTPSYAIKGPSTNGMKLLGTPQSVGEFESAIEDAS
jgi:protein-disulfide isomerase